MGYKNVTREFVVVNVEVGLQISYNLCNLPKQITTVNDKTVKYTYCAGDPVNLVDPDGLYCQTSHPNYLTDYIKNNKRWRKSLEHY